MNTLSNSVCSEKFQKQLFSLAFKFKVLASATHMVDNGNSSTSVEFKMHTFDIKHKRN